MMRKFLDYLPVPPSFVRQVGVDVVKLHIHVEVTP